MSKSNNRKVEGAEEVKATLSLADDELAADIDKIETAEAETDEVVSEHKEQESVVDEVEETSDKQLSVGKWSKEPKAEMERVFRVAKFPKGIPEKPRYHTRMTEPSTVDGIKVGAKAISLNANPALQYVLKEGAIDYAEQLIALRNLCAMGFIQEINPKFKGVVFLPAAVRAVQKAKAVYEAAQKNLNNM